MKLYRHYKGALYVVLGKARQSNNGQDEGTDVTVYYSFERKHMCVRNTAQFIELVQWPDGEMRPRFDLVER